MWYIFSQANGTIAKNHGAVEKSMKSNRKADLLAMTVEMFTEKCGVSVIWREEDSWEHKLWQIGDIFWRVNQGAGEEKNKHSTNCGAEAKFTLAKNIIGHIFLNIVFILISWPIKLV